MTNRTPRTALRRWRKQVAACRAARWESKDQSWQRAATWYGEGPGLRLALRPEALPPDPEFLALEQAILAGRATLAQTARYQTLLDQRIAALLQLAPADLFEEEQVAVAWPEDPLTSALVPCAGCGEMVMETRLRLLQGQSYCIPCFEKREHRL